MKAALIVATLVAAGVVAPLPVLAATDEAASPTSKPAVARKKMKMKAKQPMDMAAPMKTPMAKQGMTKGDVRAGAAKKDAAMAETMKQEETRMPAPAAK